MEEMNATVREVASNALQAANASHETKEKAQEGADIVNKVVSGIKRCVSRPWLLKTIWPSWAIKRKPSARS